MGKLISLTERIADRAEERSRSARGRAAFFFALDCPVSYLVAERVERDLGEIAWVPMLASGDAGWARERLLRAKTEAAAHRLPLVEPENFPFDARPAARAAVYASTHAAGAGFALAAMRLAFAGGFDMSDPDVIAEAAAAAGVPVDEALAAAADTSQDVGLESSARGLQRRGILEPPVIRIETGWFSGFEALIQTSAFTAASASYRAQPAEPA